MSDAERIANLRSALESAVRELQRAPAPLEVAGRTSRSLERCADATKGVLQDLEEALRSDTLDAALAKVPA